MEVYIELIALDKVEMLQGCFMKKEQKLNHIRQEVHVYEQRNQDHVSRLKREIDEVTFSCTVCLIFCIIFIVLSVGSNS